MAQYAVGDLQGCYDPLVKLLDQVNFDPSQDTLSCVGDLVNRGPKSLKVLRFLMSMGESCETVLGNHDIHLLAMIYGIRTPRPNDTLDKILNAPDLAELTTWLREKPLVIQNKRNKTLLCHAGIYPWWTRKQALKRARKVERLFADEPRCVTLLSKIYSNTPSRWKQKLSKTKKARFTINAFTRMRFCHTTGHMNFDESGYLGVARPDLQPWFNCPNPSLDNYRVVFGHWSALGFVNQPQFLCLDSGYVWGRDMTMVRLPDRVSSSKIDDHHIYRVSAN